MSYTETKEDCERWQEEQLIEANTRYEGCPTCGNEDVFHELIDGNLICGVCATLLKVQSSAPSTIEEEK